MPSNKRHSPDAYVKKTNGGFNEHLIMPLKRASFFRNFNEGKSVSETVERLLKVSLYKRLMRFLKRRIKQLIRKVGIDYIN